MQDTPANKITYDAKIRVDPKYIVKMSALDVSQGPLNLMNATELVQVDNNDLNKTKKAENTTTLKQFVFSQKTKIPSYLIAIAAGNLEYKKMGNKVGLIAEPSELKKASFEIRDT